jgi:HK97 family phage portal protein
MASLISRFFEKRSNQSGSTNPQQWLLNAISGLFGTTSTSGQKVNVQTTISIAAAKRCVEIISNGMVGLNVKIYSQKNGIKQVEPTYSISLLLDEPNQFQTKSEWIDWMSVNAVLRGNAYSLIVRDQYFKPISIEALLYEMVQPIMIDGVLKYQVQLKTGMRTVEAFDIIHFKGKCIDDPIVGYSPIIYHRETFGVALAATSGQSSTYKNGVLKFFIKATSSLNDSQLKDLKTGLDDVVNSKSNSLAVPGGVGVERLALTPAEAEYIASKKFSAEEIANIFNVPVDMVVSGAGSKATAEQNWQQLYANTLAPYAIKFEEELKRKLIPVKDKGIYYFKFNFNSLLRADASARAEFYNKGINNGWMTPNEARSYEDANPYEGGDQTFVNANLVPTNLMPTWIEGKIKQLESTTSKNNNPDGNN